MRAHVLFTYTRNASPSPRAQRAVPVPRSFRRSRNRRLRVTRARSVIVNYRDRNAALAVDICNTPWNVPGVPRFSESLRDVNLRRASRKPRRRLFGGRGSRRRVSIGLLLFIYFFSASSSALATLCTNLVTIVNDVSDRATDFTRVSRPVGRKVIQQETTNPFDKTRITSV